MWKLQPVRICGLTCARTQEQRWRIGTFAICLVLSFAQPTAAAQSYPAKPIRLVVPFPPGGATDILGRLFGQGLNESMGRQVIVDNRAGAGGNVGTELVAKAAPDGYTLLMVSASFSVSPSLYKLPFDPLKDLTAVSHVANVPFVLVAHPSVPASNIRELISLAQAKPNEINYASSGIGSAPHLAGELFATMARVKLTHVPYKGGGPAVADLLGGQVQLLFSTVVQVLPHIKASKLRSIGMASLRRAAVLPEVPTIDESGVSGYDMADWFGILAPMATPKPIIDRLTQEIVKYAKRDDLRSKLAGDGVEVTGSSAAEFDRMIRHDMEKFSRVVKTAGMLTN